MGSEKLLILLDATRSRMPSSSGWQSAVENPARSVFLIVSRSRTLTKVRWSGVKEGFGGSIRSSSSVEEVRGSGVFCRNDGDDVDVVDFARGRGEGGFREDFGRAGVGDAIWDGRRG